MLQIDKATLKGDFFGGLTAGIVALPLALALGVASGMGPIAGLYGAIMVGFCAALFGGTPSQISGPTGPMTVVVAGLAASLAVNGDGSGNITLIFTAIILAGLLQIGMGLLKLGDYIRLVPYPVISGFMSGIGGIILILQISPLLGQQAPAGTVDALLYTPEALSQLNLHALAIGLVSLVTVFCWPASLARFLPSPLAALIAGTLLGLILRGAPVLGAIPGGLPSPILPQLDSASLLLVARAAIVLAILGAIDSLLTSLVADNMTRSRHDSNRELIGQGIGNTLAGLFGGIAGAGATMRTVVNIRTGGTTRVSGMIHALFLLAILLGLGPLASWIPHAALAGILVKVGIDIIDWSYLGKAHRGPRWDLWLMLLVLVLTIFVDLITAVMAGVVLASLAYVQQIARDQMLRLRSADIIKATASPREIELMEAAGPKLTVFKFSGPLSFGAAADLGHHARDIFKGETQHLLLDFTRVSFLDVSAALAVETIMQDARQAKREVSVCRMNADVEKVLHNLGADRYLETANIFATRIEALETIVARMQAGAADAAPNAGGPPPLNAT